jgi:hypothetical protein
MRFAQLAISGKGGYSYETLTKQRQPAVTTRLLQGV